MAPGIPGMLRLSQCRDSLIKSRSLPSWKEAWSAAGLTSGSGAWCRGKACVPWAAQKVPEPGTGLQWDPAALELRDQVICHVSRHSNYLQQGNRPPKRQRCCLGKPVAPNTSLCRSPLLVWCMFNAFLLLWSALPEHSSSAQGPGFRS